MRNLIVSFTAALALLGAGSLAPVLAQSASEMAVRMQMLEEQVRSLMGQVEQLSFEVNQLKRRGRQDTGSLPQAPAARPSQPTQQQRLAAASSGGLPAGDDAIEIIDQQPATGVQVVDGGTELPTSEGAPPPQILGALGTAAARPGDGGFQGKVLVPPSQQEPGEEAIFDPRANQPAPAEDSIETVALSPEGPEALYERSNESLLRRQFAEAEAGFSTFLTKYPDHSLAGSAQYWLGETYYAQRDYKRAAQTFLQGYKKYPKGRRAADSLLKLGISLQRLGQTQQACAAYAAVSSEYPKAVEARKRAQAEARRAGCDS